MPYDHHEQSAPLPKRLADSHDGRPGHHARRGFWNVLLASTTRRRAARVGLLVGCLLTLIHQGELIWSGEWPSLWKIALSFLVPYCVSSYTSACLLAERQRE